MVSGNVPLQRGLSDCFTAIRKKVVRITERRTGDEDAAGIVFLTPARAAGAWARTGGPYHGSTNMRRFPKTRPPALSWPSRPLCPRTPRPAPDARNTSRRPASSIAPSTFTAWPITSRSTCRRSGAGTTTSIGPSFCSSMGEASAARRACGRRRSGCRRRCATTPSAGRSSW